MHLYSLCIICVFATCYNYISQLYYIYNFYCHSISKLLGTAIVEYSSGFDGVFMQKVNQTKT